MNRRLDDLFDISSVLPGTIHPESFSFALV